MKKIRIVFLLMISLLIYGCTNSDIEVFRFVNHQVEIHVGNEVTLQLIYGEYSEDQEVKYTLSQNDIISLEGNVAKGLKVGEVTVTATIDQVKFAKVIVNVINEPISSMRILGPSVVYNNQSIDLTVEVNPDHLANDVIWSIENSQNSDATAASIDQNGKLTAIEIPTDEQVLTGGLPVIVVAQSKVDTGMSVKKLIKINYTPTETISITAENDDTLLIPGESVQLHVEVTPAETFKKFTFSSSNTNIATVDANGLVTTVANTINVGEVTITATSFDGQQATIVIEVDYPPTETISVTAENDVTKIMPGKTAKLLVNVTPADACKIFTFTSSNISIATVSTTGVVSAKAEGSVTITVSSYDGKTTTITFTIEYPPTETIEVEAENNDTEITLGESVKLTVKVTPDTKKVYTYTSSDETIAIVSDKGEVTTPEGSTKTGEVTITVTSFDGKTATIVITVVAPSE